MEVLAEGARLHGVPFGWTWGIVGGGGGGEVGGLWEMTEGFSKDEYYEVRLELKSTCDISRHITPINILDA